jgi:hypothetical protein
MCGLFSAENKSAMDRNQINVPWMLHALILLHNYMEYLLSSE